MQFLSTSTDYFDSFLATVDRVSERAPACFVWTELNTDEGAAHSAPRDKMFLMETTA